MTEGRNECVARKGECTEEEWQAVMETWREWRRTGMREWPGERRGEEE